LDRSAERNAPRGRRPSRRWPGGRVLRPGRQRMTVVPGAPATARRAQVGRAQRVVVAGMCAAAAFLMMAAIRIPLLPQAPFLTYDPSDAVGLLVGVMYGPATGAMVVLIKDILFLLFLAKGPFGPVADFIAAGTFVAVTAWAFRRGSGRSEEHTSELQSPCNLVC